MHKNLLSFIKFGMLASAAALVLACVPLAAQAATQTAQCTTNNGQPGVYVSIAVNGQNCIAIGNSVASNGIFTLLVAIVQFLSIGVGLAVVGGIIYGGFTYITARGNAAQAEKGRNIVANAIVGLLMFVFMAAILNFLLGRNIFR